MGKSRPKKLSKTWLNDDRKAPPPNPAKVYVRNCRWCKGDHELGKCPENPWG